MRVLFLTRAFPHRPEVHTHGIFGRLKTFVQAADNSGAEITILFFIRDNALLGGEPAQTWQDRMRQYFGAPVSVKFELMEAPQKNANGPFATITGALSFFRQANYAPTAGDRQKEAVERLITEGFDVIFVHRLASMPPLLRTRNRLPRVIVDMDDIEHVAFIRAVFRPPHWWSKYLQLLQVPALLWGEIAAMRIAEHTLVCSKLDAIKLSKFGGEKVAVVPNSVRLPSLKDKQATPAGMSVLFVGTFTYPPNVQAVEFMIDEVWPIIVKEHPQATFMVVGNQPTLIKHFKTPPKGVIFSGYVTDLAQTYRKSQLVVCPVLSGGGTRIKIIEAASYGKPIVSTSLGAEGLDFINNEEILISDSPQKFAELCLKVLSDALYANKLGERALRKCEMTYDRDIVVGMIGGYLCGQ